VSDGATIGEDEASPDEENARLPERDLTVVDADQFRSVWDQEVPAAWGVIHILGDLTDDLAGQVGADAGQERCRMTEPACTMYFEAGAPHRSSLPRRFGVCSLWDAHLPSFLCRIGSALFLC